MTNNEERTIEVTNKERSNKRKDISCFLNILYVTK